MLAKWIGTKVDWDQERKMIANIGFEETNSNRTPLLAFWPFGWSNQHISFDMAPVIPVHWRAEGRLSHCGKRNEKKMKKKNEECINLV